MQKCSRGLRELCRLLGYTRQAYYQYSTGFTKRALKEELLIGQVLHHRRLQPRIGARKLLVLLQPFMEKHGINLGRDVFFELLRANGLLIRKRRRQRPCTTFSRHRFKKYPDLVKDLVVSRPGMLWVSDITYINLSKSFAYLSLVTDVYSHKIVGYCLSADLDTAGCIAALQMAIKENVIDPALLHHSDRGTQYCSSAYIKLQISTRSVSV